MDLVDSRGQCPPLAKELTSSGSRQCLVRLWKKRDGYQLELLLATVAGPGRKLVPSFLMFCYGCRGLEEIEQRLWDKAPRQGADGALAWKAIASVLRSCGGQRPSVASWPFST